MFLEGPGKGMEKFGTGETTFLIQVYSVTDTPAWLVSRKFCLSVGIINENLWLLHLTFHRQYRSARLATSPTQQ